MKKVINAILMTLLVVAGFAIIIGWFWGVPELAHLIYDKISYSVYAVIWLSIHLVRNIYGRIVAQNQLKKYAEIHNILGGK